MSKAAVDPEIERFVEMMTTDWASHPPLSTLSLPEARIVAEKVRARWTRGGPAMHATEERTVPTASGALRIRVYHPTADRRAPALIYLHGGGFTLFSIDTHDRLMREYAAEGGFAVIGVDYPLSPEVKYPGALDQIVELVRWLGMNGQTVGIDPGKIAMGGDSAGGTLTVAACLRLRDGGEGGVRAMLLNYGAFSAVCSDEAEAANGGPGAVLNRAEMDYFFGNYLNGPHEWNDPCACPISAELEGLPPAFLVIPERDILAEQSIEMAERMQRAGIDVTSKVYPGATHSFLEAMSVARLAREAIADGARWVAEKLAAA